MVTIVQKRAVFIVKVLLAPVALLMGTVNLAVRWATSILSVIKVRLKATVAH